jgi:hypothetical protein
MTFTWDPDTLSSSALQRVRLTIGDTLEADALLTDGEIEYRLSEYDDDVLLTSIKCVKDILAKLTRKTDRSNVGMSNTRSQLTVHYRDLLKDLQEEAGGLCEADVGGLSDDAEETINSDEDYRQIGITLDWGKNNG